METDADRLASIKGLGGQLVQTSAKGEFWAIFDEDYQAALSDGSVESLGPMLSSCRSVDIRSLELKKGAALRSAAFDGTDYKVMRIEKTDVPGFSRVVLTK